MSSKKSKYIEKLFEIFRRMNLTKNTNKCKILAQIFRKLISIDQKPDITLNLINDAHFYDLICCLGYLDENCHLTKDLESILKFNLKFNNFLNLTNQEVIDNINNNYRIAFLKDFVHPSFFSDRQLEELNTFIVLHNNSIVCHIDSIMKEKMDDLNLKIEENPKESLNFFTELFSILRSTFMDLKISFAQSFIKNAIHQKVISILLISLKAQKQHSFSIQQKTEINLIIQVCTEIIVFLCKNYPRAIISLFEFRNDNQSLSHLFDNFTEFLDDEMSSRILECFRIFPYIRNEPIDEDCLDFFIDFLIPFLSQKIKNICIENRFLKEIKFIEFCLDLFVIFFNFQSNRLSDCLCAFHFLNETSVFFSEVKNKRSILKYLKYLKESINIVHRFENKTFEHERIFESFWKIQSIICLKRENMLYSIFLAIINCIGGLKNQKLIDIFITFSKHKKMAFFSKESQIQQMIDQLEDFSKNNSDTNVFPKMENKLVFEKKNLTGVKMNNLDDNFENYFLSPEKIAEKGQFFIDVKQVGQTKDEGDRQNENNSTIDRKKGKVEENLLRSNKSTVEEMSINQESIDDLLKKRDRM